MKQILPLFHTLFPVLLESEAIWGDYRGVQPKKAFAGWFDPRVFISIGTLTHT
jgi:hypothetical protein